MPIIGIDFGTDSCKVAVAKLGGIDIIANEFSRRTTPSVVSFKENERAIGENGLNNLNFAPKNTIANIKKAIGLKYSQIQDIRNQFTSNIIQGPNDEILFEVNYMNQVRHFTPVQILGMLFSKLKGYAEVALETKRHGPMEAVIAVPVFFNDRQRRAVLQAAKIAGLTVLRIISDVAAAALGHAFYTKLPEPAPNAPADSVKPLHMVIVDVGHALTNVSVVALSKGQVKVMNSAFDKDLGAGDFDRILVEYFIEQIKKKYNMDISNNFKAKLRLAKECDRMKKIFSVNPVAQLRIECLMNDVDVAFELKRDDFLQMAQPILHRFEIPVKKALQESGLKVEEIHSVEIIGGGCYIPSLKQILSDVFKTQVQSQLNALESVARGCAFQCALLSPTFHLPKRFEVYEATIWPVNLAWKSNTSSANMDIDEGSATNIVDKESPLLKYNELYPTQKLVTFSRNQDFELFSVYAQPQASDLTAQGFDTLIGKVKVSGVPKKEENSKVKILVKQNGNGLLHVESAQIVEEIEVEEEVPVATEEKKTDANAAPAADANAKQEAPAAAAETPKTVKKKVKKTIKTDLTVQEMYSQYSDAEVNKFIEEEHKLAAQDRLIAETAEAKNKVESLIYELRESLDQNGSLGAYVAEDKRESNMTTLDDIENWLYSEGEDTTKVEYDKRIDMLRSLAAPAERRKQEDLSRPAALAALQGTLEYYSKWATSTDEKYAHIDATERAKVIKEVSESAQWMQSEVQQQNGLKKNQDPILTVDMIQKREQKVKDVCFPIMNKAAPKKEEPKKEAEKKEEPKKEAEAPNKEEQQEKPKDAEGDIDLD